MSHIVEIQSEVRDAAAVAAACVRLKLPPPQERTVQLYLQSVAGLAVELPGWRYPLICDLANRRVKFDVFGGHWGDVRELDRFLQAYAVEAACLEARRQGHAVTEQTLADGSIRLNVQVGGGAA